MDWQQTLSLLVVVVTAGLFLWRPLRRRFRRRGFDFHRATGCGCAGSASSSSPPPSLRVSGRRGERPRIELLESGDQRVRKFVPNRSIPH